MGGCGDSRGVRKYARDAWTNNDWAGGVKQVPRTLERPGGVGEPERAVAEILEFSGGLHHAGPLAPEVPAPDTDPAKFHVSRLHCTGGRGDGSTLAERAPGRSRRRPLRRPLPGGARINRAQPGRLGPRVETERDQASVMVRW